jgi:hypothetical protein
LVPGTFKVLLRAVRAADAGESVLIETAVEIAPNLLVYKAPPESEAPLVALLPLPPDLFEMGLEEVVEGRGARIPSPVLGRAGRCHSNPDGLLQRGGINSSWLK